MKKKKKENLREDYNDFLNEWDIIGIKDKYQCPECLYLGRKCDIHKGDEREEKWH
ncbi:hypothetical protein JY742_10095 [Clostridioides difficile]|nr:hypothetical protein [Clostridioides difficile]